jgi:SpoVK/Ycf46/Vps4 family AAA+-type ATPase
MPNDDLPKLPRRNYKSVVIQQGRVPLDPDSIEQDDLEKKETGKPEMDVHVKSFIQELSGHAGKVKSTFKPTKGFRTLLYGPPNTGKTSTAQLIATQLNKELHKVDLSKVVFKYIGETEKNLKLLFAEAEEKGWILYFDEADALFGKKTDVRDSHDKYANEHVSYLLQRISEHDGLIIMSSNSTDIDTTTGAMIDKAIRFQLPGT